MRDIPSRRFGKDDISHGLCETCAQHFMAQVGMPLSEYLESIPVPVLTTTGDGTINSANKQAMRLLDKTPDYIQGVKGGEVFECEHSRLPGGCGQTVHCSGCVIRTAIMDTMATGRAHRRVQAYLNREDGINQSLYISTEKKGGIVFLQIDSMDPVI